MAAGVRGKRLWQHFRIKLVVFQVISLEPLAVDLIHLVEFLVWLRFERGKRAYGLRREYSAVDQEQNPLAGAGFQQAVDLVDERKGLSGARGHGDEHLALSVADGPLDRRIRVELVRTEPMMRVGVLAKPAAFGVQIPREHLPQRFGRVESGDPTRTVQFVANVLKPQHLAVRRIQKRHEITVEVKRAVVHALRIPLGLGEYVLRPQRDFFRFDYAKESSINNERVVGRAVRGRKLLNCMMAIAA